MLIMDDVETKWIKEIQLFNTNLKQDKSDSEFISLVSYLVADAVYRTADAKTYQLTLMALLQGMLESELEETTTVF